MTHPLPLVINFIKAGWSAQGFIQTRAELMLLHARNGEAQRAEEYAVEIEALQEAAGFPIARMPEWASSAWRLTHTAWGNMLLAGGCYRDRMCFAADDWTAENVASHRNRSSANTFQATDVVAP